MGGRWADHSDWAVTGPPYCLSRLLIFSVKRLRNLIAMNLSRLIYLLTYMCITLCALSPHPKVLLISFDGFRYDLLNETMVPHIYRWAKDSVWFVNGSRSQYITYTAPNHMGIVTGLYEESHGIVSNYFFDPDTGTLFDYFNSTRKEGVVKESLKPHWYKGEPVWISNERSFSTRRSSAFYWPNCEAPFPSPPHKPKSFKTWTDYRNLSQWMSDVDDIVNEFTKEVDPANFVAWYVAEPDHTLHGNGFYNGALRKKLQQLDQLFEYFVAKFEDRHLFDEINVIFTADHGHAEIKDEKHVMCIRDYLPDDGFQMGDHMIYPRDEEHAQSIYRNLTQAIETHGFDVKVHMKEDFAKRYHYHNTNRVGRIIIEPMVGSAISFSCTGKQLQKDYGPNGRKFNSSTHGMDPDTPEMRAILLMKGPHIAERQHINDIPENIDLYPLMCELLGINPAANNGSLRVVGRALRKVDDVIAKGIHYNVVTDSFGFLVFFIPPFIIVLLYLAYGCRHTIMKDDPQWATNVRGYRPLNTDQGETLNDGELGGESISMSALLKAVESSEDEL